MNGLVGAKSSHRPAAGTDSALILGTMTRVYYKYAIAAVIVFDVSRPATFEAVLKVR